MKRIRLLRISGWPLLSPVALHLNKSSRETRRTCALRPLVWTGAVLWLLVHRRLMSGIPFQRTGVGDINSLSHSKLQSNDPKCAADGSAHAASRAPRICILNRANVNLGRFQITGGPESLWCPPSITPGHMYLERKQGEAYIHRSFYTFGQRK